MDRRFHWNDVYRTKPPTQVSWFEADPRMRAQARHGDGSKRVKWMTTDITEVSDLRAYDIWHDRAVFHFLTAPAERTAYRDRMRRALQPGSHAILATFAPSGPEKCSGLPVCCYDAHSLAKELGGGFALVKQLEHSHRTPGGKIQPFTFCVFRRVRDQIDAKIREWLAELPK